MAAAYALTFAAVGSAQAHEAQAARAALPPPVHEYLAEARLAGEGRLTWFGFHVYDARLFVPPGFDARDPTAQRFVLELTYARRLSGRSIADTSRDELERLGYGSESDRERWHRAMQRIFPDVERGRRIAGVNLPGRGARFYVDGRFAGAIEDEAFARGFFAIWLDARTRAPALRASLLRHIEERAR
jgi:hypothetical protein